KPKFINRPNFFILGAGRCGTTSLYYYLKQHPDIFMSPVKEPCFFCEGFQVVDNPIQYFELFDFVENETLIGEASHAYLTNPSTARVLKALFPEAKFAVILRNPADRAYSLYHWMRRYGFEKINTFEKALKAEEKRVDSQSFRNKCPQYYYNFLYFRSGLYAEQIERYFSLFDRNQFHFLTLEQLKTDPETSVKAILKFLHLSTDFKPDTQIRNKGLLTTRVPLIQYILITKVKRPFWLRKLGKKILRKTNFKEIPPIRTETRKTLLLRYDKDLRKLYHLTGVHFHSQGGKNEVG
ncbi:MAG: sulfotransferase, partial [Desulfobacterales bacterium]